MLLHYCVLRLCCCAGMLCWDVVVDLGYCFDVELLCCDVVLLLSCCVVALLCCEVVLLCWDVVLGCCC